MRLAVALPGATIPLLAAVLAAQPAVAQRSSDCLVTLDSSRVGRRIVTATGQIREYGSGGVWWSCVANPGTPNAGAVVWNAHADSVARFVSAGRIEFIGGVRFQDSTAELIADRATYHEQGERLEAQDHVRLTNRVTGTVLTGPRLTYLREVAGFRDPAELLATLRPTVVYRTEADSAEPYIILADRVRLLGNSTWAVGNVTITRSDFAAKGDSASLNIEGGEGTIVGAAEASSQDSLGFHLSGHSIAFHLVDDKLDWVQAQDSARAKSNEWDIVADTIAFSVADDLIQAALAWGDSTHPEARSQEYVMSADSLAVDTPDQQLTEIRGFGNALTTTVVAVADSATSGIDSVTSGVDSTAAEVDSLAIAGDSLAGAVDSVARDVGTWQGEADWISGDTVVARFDSTETGARTLTELIARGNAKAFYKIFDAADSTAAPAFNYSRGLTIIALFTDESVERVDVIGQADGVYLEPTKKPPS